jgi:hypothetical protein
MLNRTLFGREAKILIDETQIDPGEFSLLRSIHGAGTLAQCPVVGKKKAGLVPAFPNR